MATKRKALGKGLGALLPSVPAGPAEKTYMDLPIDEITPNQYQPRTNFNEESLNELAQSIKSDGVIQPVIVRRSGSGYELITGERRWRAAKRAGLRTIPAVIRDVSEFRTLEWALIENIQRQDLNPLEEATAYASLIDDFHLTQEELAQRVGKDRSSIANYLRLLRLPSEIKERIERNELTMGHARALISLDKAKDQLELANRIIAEQLNVRQVESLIRSGKASRKKARGGPGTTAQDPNVRAAQQKLQEYLGTKVSIGPTKIEIYYETPDDLIRIYEKLIP
jgi:ParB family transcriptional regulator, chromosome partitioning protein